MHTPNSASTSFVSAWSLLMAVLFSLLVACLWFLLAVIFWERLSLSPVGVLSALVGVAIVVRAFFVRFRIAADGLLLRGAFRSRLIPWKEVSRIGWRMAAFGGFVPVSVPVLAVQLRSGATVSATATAALSPKGISRLVNALEAASAPHSIPVNVTVADLNKWTWRRNKDERTPELK